MAAPRYPLLRLAELRAATSDGKLRDLAAALTAEAEAEAEVARRLAVVSRLRRDVTGPRLDAATPAWALHRRDTYAARQRQELDLAVAGLRHAQDRCLVARRAVAAARADAAVARAERDTVDRHHGDWVDADRKTRDRRDD